MSGDRFNTMKELSNERALRITELDRIIDRQKEEIKKLKEEIAELRSRSVVKSIVGEYKTCARCKTPNFCRNMHSCHNISQHPAPSIH